MCEFGLIFRVLGGGRFMLFIYLRFLLNILFNIPLIASFNTFLKMKEIVSLFIGQAGVQLSSAVWELFAAEHEIPLSGIALNQSGIECDGIDRVFSINSRNQAVPRCLLIDMEPTVIDEVRTGSYKQFFGPLNLLSGFEDAASIFARGYFTQGRFYINQLLEKFHQQIELADSIQAISFMHSLGGGTGSGLYSLVLEEMDNYTKITKIDMSVHPSFSSSQVIVEPYNSILAQHYTFDDTDISFIVDNEALFKLVSNQLMIEKPSYGSINKVVAQAFSLITASSRYSDHSCTLSEVLHNLVPFPRIHYPTCSLSPVLSEDHLQHSTNTVHSITKSGLSNRCQLLSCDLMEGKFMTCCLMYRGNINSGEIYEAIRRLKCYDNLKFVDWCPTGIKVTLCTKCPSYIANSKIGPSDKLLSIVANNSAVTDPLLHNTFRFQLLFQKRAFVHWFVGEGMEEDEFKDSLENLACLIKDYEECSLSTKCLAEINPVSQNNNEDANVSYKEIFSPTQVTQEPIKSLETELAETEY